MLAVRDLHVRYGGAAALNGVSLEIARGEVVALLGANGSGKTTLLNAISGMAPIVSGAVAWGGTSIEREPPHRIFRRGIVQVSQGRDLFSQLSVRDNLELGATVRGDAGRIEQVFADFPRLNERRTQLAGTLSGGEQQMVAIGRALMSDPALLMLDEPSGGLAPRFVAEIAAIMRRLRAQHATMLIVEQNIALALDVADRVYILRNGAIVACERAADLGTDHRALARQFYL